MELLNWSTLQIHLRAGNAFVLGAGGTRGAQLAFDTQHRRLSLRLPLPSASAAPPSPFSEIAIGTRVDSGRAFLEISVTDPTLFLEFHHLADIILRTFEPAGTSAFDAFEQSIRQWRSLAVTKPLLSDEQILGLRGELAVLAGLIRAQGTAMAEAWTGSTEDAHGRHDFRVGTTGLEVKSTRGRTREHVIHGTGQLEPGPGQQLWLVSLRYEVAGTGEGLSLRDAVTLVRDLLRTSAAGLARFEAGLARVGYLDADAGHYTQRLVPADVPMVMYVDSTFPALTGAVLLTAMGASALPRVSAVNYRLNVEGLGVPLGAKGCPEALKGVTID